MDRYTSILYRMPEVLRQLLYGLPEAVLSSCGTQIHSIVEHLVQGEVDDWMTKVKELISEKGENGLSSSPLQINLQNRSTMELVDNFQILRDQNLRELEKIDLDHGDLERIAVHPKFGELSLLQFLSIWAAHDLFHLQKIVGVLVEIYNEEVENIVELFSS